MSRRKVFVVGMLALAVAMVLALPSTALAAYTNPDCVSCHSTAIGAVPAQDFGVGAVNFNTACKKCHDNSLAGTHPYHNPTSNCGSSCHPGWGASLVSAVPNYTDPRGYGVFASANSADTDPAILHLIHSKPRWMESKEFSFSKCGSCHAVATCDSCHDNPPAPDDATHTNHATSLSLTPWMGNTSSGVTNGNQTDNTYVVNNASRCGAVGCHDTAGVANSTPRFLDDKSHTANAASGYLANTVTKTPSTAWKVMFSNIYTLGQISQSNTANSTLAVPFTGEQFILVSDKDPYRGIAEVLVDGVSQGTIDLYKDTTANQVEVFKSATLTPGPHTITVRVTGTKNPLARAAFVRVDQFKVFSNAPGSVAPACTSCHPSNADAHGLGNFSHEATGSAAATFSGKRCDSCHSMPMTTEHARVSSASAATGCNACHMTYAPKAMTAAWNTTCAYSTCHIAASPREPHTAMAAGHTPTSDAAEASCRGCHTGDLAAIHNNSITTNTAVSSCNSCHTPTKFPATKSCVDASCHGASVNGVVSVDAHSFNTAKHTAAPWTSAYQGASPTVSTGGKECSSCHSARVDTAHTGVTGGTVSCSTGGAGNTGCHNNTTLNGRAVASSNWTTKKCSECHNYSGNSSHDATVAPHAVAAGSCAGTTTGCHTSTDLWTLHSTSYAGGAPKYASCSNAGCHDAGNLDDRPTLKTCGTGNACHADKDLGTHPGAKDHSFTASSDYDAPTETGCTNSGAGCHGADATRIDMAVPYHPASGCISGPCHQSASKLGYGGSNECVSCHDGNYAGAPDRVTLTASHYNETTHTATAASTTTSITAGGSASARCNQCHNNVSAGIDGLYAQHQGLAASQVTSATYANLACGECHSYSTQMSAVVNTAWDDTCTACHTGTLGLAQVQHGTTAPVVNTTSTNSCGATGVNCHTTYDVHALHKDAAGGCALSGCHDYTKQGLNPTIQTCGQAGGCHAAYTNTTHLHATDAAKHQPTNTTQASATTFASTACGACHDIRNSGSSLTTEHALPTSVKTNNANVCLNCHNNAASTTAITGNWATKDTATACSTCHTGTLAIHATANSTAHTKTNTGCGNTGPGCHPTNDLSQVGTPSTTANIHTNCLRCHDRVAAATTWTSAMLTTPANMRWNPALTTCGAATGCHTSGFYNPAAGATQYYHRIGQANVVTGDDVKHTTNAAYMASTENSGTATNICSDCHIGTLASEHATTGPAATPIKVGCTTGGYAGNTAGCHNTTTGAIAPSSAAMVKNNWNSGTKTCANCHVAKHNAIATTHTGSSTAGCGASGNGCHNTYDLAALHRNRAGGGGCRLSGCHDAANKSRRPSVKTCGQATGCHVSTQYNSTQHNGTGGAGLADGNDATHHSATGNAGQSLGGYTQSTLCTNCHSTTALNTAHATTSLASDVTCSSGGTGNTGCHNQTTPINATPQVTGNWTLRTCEACHTVKHTTYTAVAHTATTSGCAMGTCHGSITDVRTLHDKVTSGCSASGTDSMGWTGACHQLNKAMAGTTMTCGDTGACHINHTASNHGVSSGGQTCYGCHSSFQANMEDGLGTKTGSSRSTSVHHVLGGALGDGDIAPNAGTYPTSQTDVYCVSCHSDHNYFNANKGANLRSNIGNTSGAAPVNTDFSATTPFGICLSCHSTAKAKQGMGTDQLNVGGANTPAIGGAAFNTSAHNYTVGSAFGASAFNANCSKCHSDEQTKQYQTSTYKFGTHYSATAGILGALGVSLADAYVEEDQCYSCHSLAADGRKTTSGFDWYGGRAMDAASQGIYQLMVGTPATAQTQTNTLYFRPSADGVPAEPMPNAHNTADTFQGGTWIGRTMAPNASATAYETKDQTTNVIGTPLNWRMVTFTSPAVATPVTVNAGTWTLNINARENNTAQNAYIRYMVYKWNANDTAGTTIVAKGTYATELGTTAAPGTSYAIPLSGSAVTLAAGDKLSVCVQLETRTTVTTSYIGSFYWGSGAEGNLALPSAVEFNWASPATTPVGRHNVAGYSGLHKPSPTDETQAYISANKHVECADCHGVHAATTARHTQGQATLSGALSGASGVSATFSGTNWTAPTAYTQTTAPTMEYQICFKCHSGANTNVLTWGGAGAASWTNQGLEFSTSNQSYHPVVAGLPVTDPGTNGSSRLQAADMRAAWTGSDGASYGGWTNGAVMYCSDCHAQSNAGSLGPHGSAVKWMLKGPNQAWPYTTAAANGTSSGTYRTYGTRDTSTGTSNGLFCNNCHVLNGTEHTRGDHNVACMTCHIRVPHGGKVSRLINAGTSANVPARYKANGNGTPVSGTITVNTFTKSTAGTYSTSNCQMTGCGSHSTAASEQW